MRSSEAFRPAKHGLDFRLRQGELYFHRKIVVDIESDLDGMQWTATTKCKSDITRSKALLGNDFEKNVF